MNNIGGAVCLKKNKIIIMAFLLVSVSAFSEQSVVLNNVKAVVWDNHVQGTDWNQYEQLDQFGKSMDLIIVGDIESSDEIDIAGRKPRSGMRYYIIIKSDEIFDESNPLSRDNMIRKSFRKMQEKCEQMAILAMNDASVAFDFIGYKNISCDLEKCEVNIGTDPKTSAAQFHCGVIRR